MFIRFIKTCWNNTLIHAGKTSVYQPKYERISDKKTYISNRAGFILITLFWGSFLVNDMQIPLSPLKQSRLPFLVQIVNVLKPMKNQFFDFLVIMSFFCAILSF